MQISNSRYLEKVFKNIQKRGILQRMYHFWDPSAHNQHIDLGHVHKTNTLFWGMFMSASMKSAIHMRPSYTENLAIYKNTNSEELQNLFDITHTLVSNKQLEILNVKTFESTSAS